jgi:hypothetical protein
MAIHINTESPCDDFEILDTPIARVLPHTGRDLLGIGHSIDGAAYGTKKQCGAGC